MLTAAQARRVAIAATGLGVRRPAGAVALRQLRKVVQQVGIVQLDSVNAVARAHELLFFSRVGPFDKQLLHSLVYERRELYEGWLHVASLIPTELWPVLAWRRSSGFHASSNEWRAKNTNVLAEVQSMLEDRGPLASSDVNHLGPKKGPWWDWSQGKRAIETMFVAGEVGVTARKGAFERVYDLIDRIVPAAVLAAPPVPEHESRRQLLLLAARSLGIATLKDLADYHRQLPTKAKPVLRELVVEGAVVEHAVEGWTEPAYALPTMKVPRRGCPDGRLVSPFDPLVWYRPRNVRLFEFDYTIEIYVPEPKRVYGYYVLPFLQGDRIVARVDVRSDRKAGVLRVPGAFSEDGATVDVDGLMAELRLLASWQGCGEVEVGDRGDLAAQLHKVRA